MRLLIMGPPGVGKGTQSMILAARLHVPAISTGDIFRAMQTGHGELAVEVRSVMSSGQYVVDDLTNRIVADRLARPDAVNGFLLDGYPRTMPQLDFLHDWMDEHGVTVDAVIALEAEETITMRRTAARAALSGREDDEAEVSRLRLQTYAEQTRALLEVYERRHLLRRIDGSGTVDEVASRIDAALELTPSPRRSGRTSAQLQAESASS